MAVADVQKIRIITHKNDKEKVVNFLYGAGLIEISKWKGKAEKYIRPQVDEAVSNIEYRLSEIQFAIKFLEEFKEKEKLDLVSKFSGAMISTSSKKINKILKDLDIDELISKVKGIEEKINKNQTEIDRITEENELLHKWIQLDINIDEARETDFTKAIFATVDSEKYLELIRQLDKKINQIDIRKISSAEQKDYLLVVYNKKFDKEVARMLFKYDVEKAELPNINLTPKELIDNNFKKRKDLKKEISELKRDAGKRAKENLKKLKIIFDYYKWNSDKLSIERDFVETESTIIINGWIEKNNTPKIENGLKEISSNINIEVIEPQKGELKPVVIRNSNFMQPFESVTNIYGLPKTTEVDPTPFLSIFFIIFFGLCLTDAGYGLVLMTLTYLAIKVLKIPREKQKLIRLLMYGGFVTFIVGALTGGWFGLVLEDLPESLTFLRIVLQKIQLINPVENPIIMLILSFILGFIQILAGLAIDMWWKIKNKQVMDGILDSGTWIYFLLTMAFYGMTAFGIVPESLKDVAFYLFILGVVIIVATQGRKKKSIIMKILSGVGSLYGLVGYMSDILSYSRLLALGLATAVIAMVINLIAVMFKDMVPVVGWVLMILIIIGGHIFNIVINVLGAYIHSGRLQFVEFFPKFFQGGGRIFRPFKRESKYVSLK